MWGCADGEVIVIIGNRNIPEVLEGHKKEEGGYRPKAVSPMTEASFYVLLSLRQERHGYEITQWVRELTDGEVELQGGTVYNCLLRMERNGLIRVTLEKDRRKYYQLTETGEKALRFECLRLARMYQNSQIYPGRETGDLTKGKATVLTG